MADTNFKESKLSNEQENVKERISSKGDECAEEKERTFLQNHSESESDEDRSSDSGCIISNSYDDEKSTTYFITLTAVWVFSLITRLYMIDQPTHVCWDETHFGKFANYYLNGTFYFDVHPPLGKMLLALAGYASGYNAAFPFEKPGEPYGDHNYVGMRVFCALLGGFCVPLAYLIVWELTRSIPAAVLAASFILFDHGCLTLSQYILLDPILMFFMLMAVFSYLKFYSWRDCPFSIDWWGWMCCTGYFLACTFSVKWVGLFVILFAGVSTAAELWDILGDLSLSLVDVGKHVAARVVGLIVLPISVYLLFFAIHFQAVPNTGNGDGFFSSSFQSTLKGNQLYKAVLPAELAYGATITLRNNKVGGSILHSHPHLYPKEAPPEQQQITGYSHKDPNNNFRVKPAYEPFDKTRPVDFVKDGDLIRLEHIMTSRNVHSHQEKAPMSKHLFQVSGYGENGEGDVNDVWRVKVVSGSTDNRIQTVRTIFKLIHTTVGCALYETDQTLPKWGWEQREMACNPNIEATGANWNVEYHENERVPKASMDLLSPSFIESVIESHIVMAQTNNGFKPKEGEVVSQPWQWILNYRGQVFSGLDHRIYLLGNPIIWWSILAAFGVFAAVYLYHEILEKRKYVVDPAMADRRRAMVHSCGWLLLGWAFHYLPFFAMGRVLYFHHYFPAYLFTAMFAGVFLDYVCFALASFAKDEQKQKQIFRALICFIILVCFSSFMMFRGLSYGMNGLMASDPNSTYRGLKWLDSWEI